MAYSSAAVHSDTITNTNGLEIRLWAWFEHLINGAATGGTVCTSHSLVPIRQLYLHHRFPLTPLRIGNLDDEDRDFPGDEELLDYRYPLTWVNDSEYLVWKLIKLQKRSWISFFIWPIVSFLLGIFRNKISYQVIILQIKKYLGERMFLLRH